jgi:hypothetical protein
MGPKQRRDNILGGHRFGNSKQTSVYVRVLFRTVPQIELTHSTVPKLLIRKRYKYYVPFRIPVFIVQMTKLVVYLL